MPFFRPTPAPNADPLPPDDPAAPFDADHFFTPEDVAERSLRRRRLLRLLIIVVVLIGGGIGAKPALHAAKAWQARRTAAEAERLTAEHKWVEARTKVQDALQLWRQEPAALRATAIFLARTGNLREAATFWKQVEVSRPLTRDEEREYSTALLATGDLAAAEDRLHKAWPSGQDGTPADWDLAMQIAHRRSRAPETVDLAHRVLASSQASARQRLNAGLALLSLASADTQASGWDEILALARGQKSPESLDALVILAQRVASLPGGTPPAANTNAPFPALPELISRIEAHPLARIQHRLLTLDLQIARDPARLAECIQTATDRFAGSKDDADLAALAGWLYGKKEYARILDVIPAGRAPDDRALFSQRLDALAALNRWGEVREAIQSRKIALDPMIEQMYLARCAEKLGEPQVRDARWDAALDAAGANPEKLAQLGQYARTDGATGVAEKAFRAAIQAAPDAREPYTALVELQAAQAQTGKVRETLNAMLSVWPQDRAVRNDVAYFDALLNENLPAALETARQLVHDEPASLPHRVTLALAQLRSGNALAALDAFGGITMARNVNVEPRQRAVYAAVLWAASYNAEAREALQDLPLERLLPEERTLVQPIQEEAANR